MDRHPDYAIVRAAGEGEPVLLLPRNRYVVIRPSKRETFKVRQGAEDGSGSCRLNPLWRGKLTEDEELLVIKLILLDGEI